MDFLDLSFSLMSKCRGAGNCLLLSPCRPLGSVLGIESKNVYFQSRGGVIAINRIAAGFNSGRAHIDVRTRPSFALLSRAAGNRTRSKRTPCARTTGILQPVVDLKTYRFYLKKLPDGRGVFMRLSC